MNPYKKNLITDPLHPALHTKCNPVNLRYLGDQGPVIDRMLHLQKQVAGIGLAANQLGILRRIITVADEQTGKIYGFINPRITGAKQSDDNVYWHEEGCLSHPGVSAEVARYKTINFAAYTLNTGKKEQKYTASGLIARIIQHEIDHLNGLLYTDLGAEVRNFNIDPAGQIKLAEATAKTEEHGHAATEE